MGTQLRKAPVFVVARSETGALAADSSVINDVNFVPASISLEPHGGWPTLVGHWFASGGTVAPTDWVDLQILHRDQKSSTAMWMPGPVISGLLQYETFSLPTHGCTQVAIRIDRVSCAAGTGLVVMAASSPYAL